MAPSPLADADGVVRIHITADGQELPPTVQIRSLRTNRAVNAVPSAQLVIEDGDVATGDFAVADTDLLKPGAAITISLGYGDSEAQVFGGVVVRLGLKITGDNDARLVVECRDKVSAMTLGRVNANHVDKTDSDIVSALIAAHGDLTADVEATSVQHGHVVQHDCSDWDFMLARADVNGLIVVVTDGTVTVKAPAVDSAPTLAVAYGRDLVEFHADIDARTQVAAVESASWDPKSQSVVTGSAATTSRGLQGDLESATLAAVLGPDTWLQQAHASQPAAVLTGWSKARQLKADLARVRGRMSFQGSALAACGGTMEIAGVGSRFNGTVFVSAVEHRVSDGNWMTEVEFGLAPQWFVERADVMAPPAAGLLPGVHGLQVGVVMKLDEDPAGEHRIQVKVPVSQAVTPGVWARWGSLHASSAFGAFFVPEVGDEVILGFFDDDPSQPVVLGSLYSSSRAPAQALAADNPVKCFVTRCKSKIEFDETDKVITITTPGSNKLVFSDKDKSILVQDQNGNKIELAPGGITLDSPKDIKISAKGSITIDAVGKIATTSKADVTTSGLNVTLEAQVGFTGKGSATAELSAAGQTTVKGAMVMIN